MYNIPFKRFWHDKCNLAWVEVQRWILGTGHQPGKPQTPQRVSPIVSWNQRGHMDMNDSLTLVGIGVPLMIFFYLLGSILKIFEERYHSEKRWESSTSGGRVESENRHDRLSNYRFSCCKRLIEIKGGHYDLFNHVRRIGRSRICNVDSYHHLVRGEETH